MSKEQGISNIDNSAYSALLPDLETKKQEWKAQHGDVYELIAEETDENISELGNTTIYCKAPGRVELARFVKDAATGDALKAQNNFFFGCLLYPDAEVIKRISDKKPGIVIALGNKLQELTGINQNFTMRKL